MVFTARILHVNLSTGEHWIEELDKPAEKLLGGRGLASYLVYKYTDRGTEPLSPDNPLVLAPGLLTGSGLSTASKSIFAARSPLTGFLGRSAVGAHAGWKLKASGIDALVVHGALESPGLLLVDGEKAVVEDAGGLWGRLVSESHKVLGERYRGFSTCVIGPAGENLSKIAGIDCNGRQAGRTGLGAVMGSKKLKAIAVKARGAYRSSSPGMLRRLIREWALELPSTQTGRNLVRYGTPGVVNLTEAQGIFPSLNWRRSTLQWCGNRDRAREKMASVLAENGVGRNPCPYCNRPCSQVVEAVNPFGGGRVRIDGPEYEVLYSLGSNIGLCDPMQTAMLSYMADELGFDAISLGSVIAWAIELNEKELLGDYSKGYEGLSWGSTGMITRLIEDMAYRRSGLGELLADGVLWAVRKLKWGMDEAVHVKGLELPAYDARGLKGMALGYAVSSRGGDHLTSGMYALELGGKLWIYTEPPDPLGYTGKPVIVKTMENLFALYDVLGVCKFSRYELTPERLAEAVEAVAGLDLGVDGVLMVGERVVTLERVINIRYGLKAGDDTLPPRLLYQPISDGPRRGEVVDVYELDRMKAEYYRLRGWSRRGIPYRETLIQLGLEEIGVSLETGLGD